MRGFFQTLNDMPFGQEIHLDPDGLFGPGDSIGNDLIASIWLYKDL
jgi:hypothetical protein